MAGHRYPESGRQSELYPGPLEFSDRLAALVPPPRKHRQRYHGVLAPNSSLRPAVTVYASLPLEASLPSVPLQEDTRAPEDPSK
ncbi:transposase [Methyloterricola oryzae]|uniref:transposase n=1 Tax=Methyloterricola oryzae TaxID=1495050 RepID=UPI00130154D5